MPRKRVDIDAGDMPKNFDNSRRGNGDGFALVMANGHAKWRRRTLVNGIYTGGTDDSEWLAAQP